MSVFDRLSNPLSFTGVYGARMVSGPRINDAAEEVSSAAARGQILRDYEDGRRTSGVLSPTSLAAARNRAKYIAAAEESFRLAQEEGEEGEGGAAGGRAAGQHGEYNLDEMLSASGAQHVDDEYDDAEPGDSASATMPSLDMNTHLQLLFQFYCRYGRTSSLNEEQDTMDSFNFAKLMKESPGLLDRALNATEVDLIFVKCKAKAARRISYGQFLDALSAIAAIKYPEEFEPASAFHLVLENHILRCPAAHGIASAVASGVLHVDALPQPESDVADLHDAVADDEDADAAFLAYNTNSNEEEGTAAAAAAAAEEEAAAAAAYEQLNAQQLLDAAFAAGVALPSGHGAAPAPAAPGPATPLDLYALIAQKQRELLEVTEMARAAGLTNLPAPEVLPLPTTTTTASPARRNPKALSGVYMQDVVSPLSPGAKRNVEPFAASNGVPASTVPPPMSSRQSTTAQARTPRATTASAASFLSASASLVRPVSAQPRAATSPRTYKIQLPVTAATATQQPQQQLLPAAPLLAPAPIPPSGASVRPRTAASPRRSTIAAPMDTSISSVVALLQPITTIEDVSGARSSRASSPRGARSASPRYSATMGTTEFKPTYAGEANRPGGVYDRLSSPSSFTGVYRRAWFTDGRMNHFTETGLSSVPTRFEGNTNTNSDETIRDIGALLRPNLRAGKSFK